MAIYNNDEERIGAFKLHIEGVEKIPVAEIVQEVDDKQSLIDFLLKELSREADIFSAEHKKGVYYRSKTPDILDKLIDTITEDDMRTYFIDKICDCISQAQHSDNQDKPAIIASGTEEVVYSCILNYNADDLRRQAILKASSVPKWKSFNDSAELVRSFLDESYKIEFLKRMISSGNVIRNLDDPKKEIESYAKLIQTMKDDGIKRRLLEAFPKKLKIMLVPYLNISDDEKIAYINPLLNSVGKNIDAPEILFQSIASLKEDSKKIEYIFLLEKMRREYTPPVNINYYSSYPYLKGTFDIIFSLNSSQPMKDTFESYCNRVGNAALKMFAGTSMNGISIERSSWNGTPDDSPDEIFRESLNNVLIQAIEERNRINQEKEQAARDAVARYNEQAYGGNSTNQLNRAAILSESADDIIQKMEDSGMGLTDEQKDEIRKRMANRDKERREEVLEAHRQQSLATEERNAEIDEMVFEEQQRHLGDVISGQKIAEMKETLDALGITLTEEQRKKIEQYEIDRDFYNLRYSRAPQLEQERAKIDGTKIDISMPTDIGREMRNYYEPFDNKGEIPVEESKGGLGK